MSDFLKNEIPSLASVVQQAILNKLKEVHTCMPGIIVSFNTELQTAEVQPAIQREFYVTNSESKRILTPTNLPVLINVPVLFPRGGGFSLTFPVVAGDECLLQFCERDIDKWHNNGEVQSPNSFRQHSLSDAVCFVGMASKPNVISDFDNTNVELRDSAGTTTIRITPDNKLLFDAVTEIKITAPDTTWVGDIDLTGNIVHTGDTNQTGDVTLEGDIGQTGDVVRDGTLNQTGQADVKGNVVVTSGDVVADTITLKTHVHPITQPNGTPSGTAI